MIYNLNFDQKRNVSYIFDFSTEKKKVYSLNFKKLPVYEIIINSLKTIEKLDDKAEIIKNTEMLSYFIKGILKNKNRNFTFDNILEISMNGYSDKKLRNILDSNFIDIDNIMKKITCSVEEKINNGILLEQKNINNPMNEINIFHIKSTDVFMKSEMLENVVLAKDNIFETNKNKCYYKININELESDILKGRKANKKEADAGLIKENYLELIDNKSDFIEIKDSFSAPALVNVNNYSYIEVQDIFSDLDCFNKETAVLSEKEIDNKNFNYQVEVIKDVNSSMNDFMKGTEVKDTTADIKENEYITNNLPAKVDRYKELSTDYKNKTEIFRLKCKNMGKTVIKKEILKTNLMLKAIKTAYESNIFHDSKYYIDIAGDLLFLYNKNCEMKDNNSGFIEANVYDKLVKDCIIFNTNTAEEKINSYFLEDKYITLNNTNINKIKTFNVESCDNEIDKSYSNSIDKIIYYIEKYKNNNIDGYNNEISNNYIKKVTIDEKRFYEINSIFTNNNLLYIKNNNINNIEKETNNLKTIDSSYLNGEFNDISLKNNDILKEKQEGNFFDVLCKNINMITFDTSLNNNIFIESIKKNINEFETIINKDATKEEIFCYYGKNISLFEKILYELKENNTNISSTDLKIEKELFYELDKKIFNNLNDNAINLNNINAVTFNIAYLEKENKNFIIEEADILSKAEKNISVFNTKEVKSKEKFFFESKNSNLSTYGLNIKNFSILPLDKIENNLSIEEAKSTCFQFKDIIINTDKEVDKFFNDLNLIEDNYNFVYLGKFFNKKINNKEKMPESFIDFKSNFNPFGIKELYNKDFILIDKKDKIINDFNMKDINYYKDDIQVINNNIVSKKVKSFSLEEFSSVLFKNIEMLFPYITTEADKTRKIFNEYDNNYTDVRDKDILSNFNNSVENKDKIFFNIDSSYAEEIPMLTFNNEAVTIEKTDKKLIDSFDQFEVGNKAHDINDIYYSFDIEKIKKELNEPAEVNYFSLSKNEIFFNKIPINENKNKEFFLIEEDYANFKKNDIIFIDNTYLEKKNKELEEYRECSTNLNKKQIYFNNISLIENISKKLEDYMFDSTNISTCEIFSHYNKYLSTKKQLFNGIDIKDAENGFIENKDFNFIKDLEKKKKLLESYNDDYINSQKVEVKRNNKALDIEKIKKMFNSFDIKNFNVGLTETEDYKNITDLIEKNKKFFDNTNFFDDLYIKGIDINFNKYTDIEKKSKRTNEILDNKYGNINKINIEDNHSNSYVEKNLKKMNEISNDNYADINKTNIIKDDFKYIEKYKKEFGTLKDKFNSVNNLETILLTENFYDRSRKNFNEIIDNKFYKSGNLTIDKTNGNYEVKVSKLFSDNTINNFIDVNYFNIDSFSDNSSNVEKIKVLNTEEIKSIDSLKLETKNYDIDLSNTINKKFNSFTDGSGAVSHKIESDIKNISTLEKGKNKLYIDFSDFVDKNLLEVFCNNQIKFKETTEEEVNKIYTQFSYNILKDIIINIIQEKEIDTNEIIYNKNTKWLKNEEINIKIGKISSAKNKYISSKINKGSFNEINKIEILDKKNKNMLFNSKLETYTQNTKLSEVNDLEYNIIHINHKDLKKDEIFDNDILDFTSVSKQDILIDKIEEKILKKDEIFDNDVNNFINIKKIEIIKEKENNTEIPKDEIIDIDAIDFIEIKNLEIDLGDIKNASIDIEDEIKDISEEILNFATKGQLEILKETVKDIILSEDDEEIYDEDPIKNLTEEKDEIYNNDIITNIEEIKDEIYDNDNIDFISEKNDEIYDSDNIKEIEDKKDEIYNEDSGKYVSNLTKEIFTRTKHPGVETGARGYDFRLKDNWSQDWIHLTYRKTNLGVLIEKRNEAIQDFQNFRVILKKYYSYPISGNLVMDFISKLIENTNIDIEYINELGNIRQILANNINQKRNYNEDELEFIFNATINRYKKFFINSFDKKDLCDGHEEVRIRLKAMLTFFIFIEQLIDSNKGYLHSVSTQEGIKMISEVLWKWYESETSYYEPTEEEKKTMDKDILKRLKENLPIDYKFLIRWFDWYAEKEIFLNGFKFDNDAFTSLSNIRDEMISYFDTHWGKRKTNYNEMIEKAEKKNLVEKPAILIDKSVIDKIRGLKHGIKGMQKSSINMRGKMVKNGWAAINKEDKNKPLTLNNTSGKNKGNLKDSYNIDLQDLIYKIFEKEVYNKKD